MKTKDIVYIVLSVVIFSVAGYLAFTLLLPSQGSTSTAVQKVEVVGAISQNLDSTVVDKLADSTKTLDYTVVLDLTSGMGNQSVFGQ